MYTHIQATGVSCDCPILWQVVQKLVVTAMSVGSCQFTLLLILVCSMQELVQRKLELAELNESYDLLCHAFLKADEAKNAPIIAKLQNSGMMKPGSLHLKVKAG